MPSLICIPFMIQLPRSRSYNVIASTFHSAECLHTTYSNYAMSTSWDNARRHARALETALDSKLSSYSKLAASIARGSSLGGSSSRDELSMEEEGIGGYKLVEEEIEELLSKVGLTYSLCPRH